MCAGLRGIFQRQVHRGLFNLRVKHTLVLLRLATSDVELAAARLPMWQAIARDPAHHVLLIATIFGSVGFERSTADFTDPACHPYYSQFCADF